MQLFADLGAGRSSSGDVTVTVGPARSAVCSFLQILEQVGLFSSRSGQTVNKLRGIAAHLRLSSWDEDGLQLFADLGAGRSSSGDVAVSVGPARSASCSILISLEQVGAVVAT